MPEPKDKPQTWPGQRGPLSPFWKSHCMGCGEPWMLGFFRVRERLDFRVCMRCDVPWDAPTRWQRLAFWWWRARGNY